MRVPKRASTDRNAEAGSPATRNISEFFQIHVYVLCMCCMLFIIILFVAAQREQTSANTAGLTSGLEGLIGALRQGSASQAVERGRDGGRRPGAVGCVCMRRLECIPCIT